MATTEEKRESIYRKMKKLQAYREVENLMGRCVFAFNYHQKAGVLSFVAKYAFRAASTSAGLFSSFGITTPPQGA